MVKDATMVEKIIARFKYLFAKNKKKVVGYRTDKKSDLLRPGYSLGRKYINHKGKEQWVVDPDYYKSKGYINGEKGDPKTGKTRIAEGFINDPKIGETNDHEKE